MTAARLGAILALVLGLRPAFAQAGHDPAHSPFRDVRHGSTVRVIAGHFSGDRGTIQVGPSEGPTGGLRYEYAVSNLLMFAAGVSYAQTTAFFVNPYDSIPKPYGPIDNDLVMADLSIQASLTGSKTFYGFQPYVGGALGFVFGSPIGADTSGYSFGTKFSVAPDFGVRWYPARRLSAELDYRVVYYKQQYPLSYRPTLVPLTQSLTEWTSHPWVTFGIGWTF